MAVTDENNNYKLRTGMENAGYSDIKYDEQTKNVTGVKNGQTVGFNTSGLSNVDGSLVGTQAQINGILANPMIQVRNTGIQNGLNVGADQYNNPMYNGQSLDTTGMVLVNGNWYGRADDVNKTVQAIKPKEYVNPYAQKQNKLLDDLLNYKSFSYDPQNDQDLQAAMELARRQSIRDAENKGQANSFGMTYAASQAANSLIPQYRQLARQDYESDRSYLADLYGITSEAQKNDLAQYQMSRGFANDDRDYASNREIAERGLAQSDRSLEEQIRQFDITTEEGRRQFNDTMSETIRMNSATMDNWHEQNLIAWAQHRLDGMKFVSDVEAQKWARALDIFTATGAASQPWVANTLGLPLGTTTLQAAEAYAQIGNINAQTAQAYAQIGNINAKTAQIESPTGNGPSVISGGDGIFN